MPYDERLATRIRQALDAHENVVEKKMMGGLCFMLGDHMCCGVSRSGLMIRVGAEAYEAALGEAHVAPLEMSGRRPRGFIIVEPPGYRTTAQLVRYVRRAIDYVTTLPPKTLKRGSASRK